MAGIIYFGKPNCINNQKQISILKAAGHEVREHDICSYPWTTEVLRRFFGQLPVCEWFNLTAPAIKSRTMDVNALSDGQALAAMIQDPLLIRRPLMEIDGRPLCGFRIEQLDRQIGLSPVPGAESVMQKLSSQSVTQCPFTNTDMNCDKQNE